MKYARKQKRKLKKRILDYEKLIAQPQIDSKGYRKPGSNKK